MFQSVPYGLLHGVPHFFQIVPDVFSFAFFYIFPITLSGMHAPSQDFCGRVHRVYFFKRQVLFSLFTQCSSADTEHSPILCDVSFCVESLKLHAVRMVGKESLRFPNDCSAWFVQYVENRFVCHMSFSCSGQTAVEGYFKTYGLRIAFQKKGGGLTRSHGMTARRAVADTV